MKKICIICMLVLNIFTTTSYAADNQTNDDTVFLQESDSNKLTEIYPETTILLDELFQENTGSIKIIDKEGNDITNQFVDDNLDCYKQKDLNAIIRNYIELEGSISKRNIPSLRYTSRVEKVYDFMYRILTINGRATTSEIGFYPYASASYNDTNGTYSNASLSIKLAGVSYFNAWNYRVEFVETYLNNRRSVRFTDNYLYVWGSMQQGGGTAVLYYDPIIIPTKTL